MTMQHAIETLFSRWNLDQVSISGSEVWACCPIHGESKPSFSVNIETGKWHCFSCKESGTKLKELVARMEDIPLREADGFLEDFGVNTLAALKEELRSLFHLYVVKRLGKKNSIDLTRDDSWKRFDGVIPDYMLNRKFTKEILEQHHIGYDKTRRMVIIPVFEGKICRFVYTRITWKRKSGKKSYDYPSDVDRGMYLWGLDKPEREYYGRPIYICEGAFDALWLRQNGYDNAVAILGSYLTKVQQAKIENLCPSEIILAFDNDKAGYLATLFAGRMFLRAGFRRVMYLPYPKGVNDPPKATSKQLTRMVARKKSVKRMVLENPINPRTKKMENKPFISKRLDRLTQ